MFGVQKASLNMSWEYSPYSTNLASDWLREESSPVDEEERKEKKKKTSLISLTVSVDVKLVLNWANI